jgi:hypothetical protein
MTDEPHHDPDAIIRRVLSLLLVTGTEYVRRGSRRCVLVLDDSTAVLKAALKDANFWPITLPKGMNLADFETRDLLLPGHILVTMRTADYLDHAPVLDYAIIGLDALPTLATTETYVGNATVQMLSNAVTRHHLVSTPPAWVIMLVEAGEHVFERLE